MIVLDTHILIWWLIDDPNLTQPCRQVIEDNLVEQGLGVSVFSCWEIAMLVSKGRIQFNRPVAQWIADALSPPEMRLLELTPGIAIASTELPGQLHGDPADRIIIATARAYNCPLLTLDGRIRAYPEVITLP